MTLQCSDCGKAIYASDEEENVGGKHAALWDDTSGATSVRFICMPCSDKYEDITAEMTSAKNEGQAP